MVYLGVTLNSLNVFSKSFRLKRTGVSWFLSNPVEEKGIKIVAIFIYLFFFLVRWFKILLLFWIGFVFAIKILIFFFFAFLHFLRPSGTNLNTNCNFK